MSKKTIRCRKINHKLAVYYVPEYNGLVVVHSENSDTGTVTIGGCCNFYDDAYTNITRHVISKENLEGWVRLNKRKLHTYDIIKPYELIGTYTYRVCKNKQEKSYLFYKDKCVLETHHVSMRRDSFCIYN